MPGFYNDCTLEKIACINRAGIRSVVMTTVSGTNIDEVPGIIDAVVAAGANVFAFARYCPTSEYFNLGVRPIFRETYSVNGGQAAPKGYRITDACIGCGRCGLGRCKHPPPHTARQRRLPNHKRRAGPAGL